MPPIGTAHPHHISVPSVGTAQYIIGDELRELAARHSFAHHAASPQVVEVRASGSAPARSAFESRERPVRSPHAHLQVRVQNEVDWRFCPRLGRLRQADVLLFLILYRRD